MMPLIFASCGDDNDEPVSFKKQIIGEWVENNGIEAELFHIKFDSNYKGLHWITENGVIIDQTPFTWAEDGNTIVITVIEDGITSTGKGVIKNGLLYIYGDEEGEEYAIAYKKVK